MTKWKVEIDIKKHLRAYEDHEDLVKTSLDITDEMEKSLKIDDELSELLLDLSLAADVDVNEFDMALSAVYDYADEHRIWMGL